MDYFFSLMTPGAEWWRTSAMAVLGGLESQAFFARDNLAWQDRLLQRVVSRNL